MISFLDSFWNVSPTFILLEKNEISLELRSPKSIPIYVSMVDKKQTCHSLKNIDEMGVDNNKKYVHIFIYLIIMI